MNIATLDIPRCPYCGGRLDLVTAMFHRRDGDDVHDGILGCQCCIFAIVDGIPVMHLDGSSKTARAHVEAGRPDLARRAMFNLDDEAHAARFDEVASSHAATYRDVVDALGPTFEGGYFLYRFPDPTYIVADAVVRSVASAVLKNGGRAGSRWRRTATATCSKRLSRAFSARPACSAMSSKVARSTLGAAIRLTSSTPIPC